MCAIQFGVCGQVRAFGGCVSGSKWVEGLGTMLRIFNTCLHAWIAYLSMHLLKVPDSEEGARDDGGLSGHHPFQLPFHHEAAFSGCLERPLMHTEAHSRIR